MERGARETETENQLAKPWREGLFVLATILLAIGLLSLGVTTEGPVRWFCLVLLAIILGNQLARPLLLLAAGVSEVAAGDLSPKPALQGKDELDHLLGLLAESRRELNDRHGRRVPMAVKVAPDLLPDNMPAVAEVVTRHGMDAVVATNTTLSRAGVEGMEHAEEAGGLSGAPLKELSDRVLAKFRSLLPLASASLSRSHGSPLRLRRSSLSRTAKTPSMR